MNTFWSSDVENSFCECRFFRLANVLPIYFSRKALPNCYKFFLEESYTYLLQHRPWYFHVSWPQEHIFRFYRHYVPITVLSLIILQKYSIMVMNCSIVKAKRTRSYGLWGSNIKKSCYEDFFLWNIIFLRVGMYKVFVFDNIYFNASKRAQGSHMTIITWPLYLVRLSWFRDF